MGVAAGYLPWLLYLNRTVFQFYTIVFEPYLILALTAAIGVILGKSTDSDERRFIGSRVVITFVVVATVVSGFFYPVWTGIQTPFWFWQLHMWLPTWR
jgi:dolichyl-phosphate-mannose--protein O-mannosyl transferase